MVTVTEDPSNITSLVLEPNHSLSPEVHHLLLVCMTGLFIVLSVLFVVLGAWLVVPFIALELFLIIMVLGLVQARGRAREEVSISGSQVKVHKLFAGRHWDWRFDREKVSLMISLDDMDEIHHLTLCGDSGLVELGDFLSAEDLQLLLQQLREKGLYTRRDGRWGYLAC